MTKMNLIIDFFLICFAVITSGKNEIDVDISLYTGIHFVIKTAFLM